MKQHPAMMLRLINSIANQANRLTHAEHMIQALHAYPHLVFSSYDVCLFVCVFVCLFVVPVSPVCNTAQSVSSSIFFYVSVSVYRSPAQTIQPTEGRVGTGLSSSYEETLEGTSRETR